MKFVLFAPGYNTKIGGSILMHKLTHILNELGHDAYIYPYFQTFLYDRTSLVKLFFKVLESKIRYKMRFKHKRNSSFNTPFYLDHFSEITDDVVVVYPEGTVGNPLKAKNVVRWLLNKPGLNGNPICYGPNELYFDHHAFAPHFCFPGSRKSKNILHITHFPFEIYNLNGALVDDKRFGTAYCLRKGKTKNIVHDLQDSILIDNLEHEEIASVFKRVKTFISYDVHTAYTRFAAMCGANVVVIPNKGVTKKEWLPYEWQRLGAAYGFEDLEYSISTKHLVESVVRDMESKQIDGVKIFIDEVQSYFSLS